MRRLSFATAVFLVAMSGVAAALTYVPGAYNVDSCLITTARPCSHDPNGKLRMTITRGHFKVRRVSFTETCDNGVRSFKERFTFISGTNAKLAGSVGSMGHFHGRFQSSAGFVKVVGVVQGRRLQLDATEGGSFTQGDEPTFNCSGSTTFHAKRS
jgi:hypothetical protein